MITLASPRALAAGLLLAVPFALSACGTSDQSAPASTAAQAGDCPTTPVDVVVSVDQWGQIVSALGGACANVTTVLAGSSADPHDFEPSPSDAAAFEGAQLVVINGGHYDEWAAKLAESTAPDA
ncbi:MAG: metal ABC transporter solute-binding protein, Zn/Mn family, partial [Microbacteriaceae bacterium]